MPPTTSRRSYTAAFKLEAIAYAKENGNRAAGRHYGISEKIVRDWRQTENCLRLTKKSKKADRGNKARWPVLEEKIESWVLEQRASSRGISTIQIRLKALDVAKEIGIDDFGLLVSKVYVPQKSLAPHSDNTESVTPTRPPRKVGNLPYILQRQD